MEDHGIDIDWDSYFPGIANYYADSEGRLWSIAVQFLHGDDVLER